MLNILKKKSLFVNSILWYATLPLPRTPVMYAIISLHDHILFIMCIILTIVIYLLLNTLYEYIYNFDNVLSTSENNDINIYYNESSFINNLKQSFLISQLPFKLPDNILNVWFKVYIKWFSFQSKLSINNHFDIKHFDKIKEIIWSKKRYSWLTISHCTMLEIYWTILPCILLVLIAVPSFWLLYAFDEIMDPSITIRVIGHQWYWSYEMSDFNEIAMHCPWKLISQHPKIRYDSYLLDIAELQTGDFRLLKTTNPLVLPKDLHIRLLITSDDVLHSFSVPAFGIKIDAVPGRLNQVSIFIRDYGIFFGQCSELCGANHGFMPIEIFVLPVRQFYWLLYDSIIYPNRWWFYPDVVIPRESLEKVYKAFEWDWDGFWKKYYSSNIRDENFDLDEKYIILIQYENFDIRGEYWNNSQYREYLEELEMQRQLWKKGGDPSKFFSYHFTRSEREELWIPRKQWGAIKAWRYTISAIFDTEEAPKLLKHLEDNRFSMWVHYPPFTVRKMMAFHATEEAEVIALTIVFYASVLGWLYVIPWWMTLDFPYDLLFFYAFAGTGIIGLPLLIKIFF